MAPTPDIRPYVVELDLYVARRRRLHEVRQPNGAAVFHAPHLTQVLNWLIDNGVGSAEFTDDDVTFVVSFSRKTSPPPPDEGNPHG